MDARVARLVIGLSAFLSLAANYRTRNFIVVADTPQLAKEVGETAEAQRRQLAFEWLGHELPPWREPCPIRVVVQPGMPAGGQTSFFFSGGQPGGWEMIVQGTRERVLDSVLPHEITHTIFATHFGRPLPRWADEGACTTVEHMEERGKQDRLLIQFLTSVPSRGIAFNDMFAMTEYPSDILPLYSQGYSLAKFLIAHADKPTFVRYVGEGMETNNWTYATSKYYGYESLSELQLTWVDWVGRGSPPLTEAFLEARRRKGRPGSEVAAADYADQTGGDGRIQLVSTSPDDEMKSAASSGLSPQPRGTSNLGRALSDNWYARQRQATTRSRDAMADGSHASARPQDLQRIMPRVIEPSRAAPIDE